MASGHVNRANRPNTWLHRPSLRREDSTCQPGAVHTWHIASVRPPQQLGAIGGIADMPRSPVAHPGDVNDPQQTSATRGWRWG
jgi:hypothetical protein